MSIKVIRMLENLKFVESIGGDDIKEIIDYIKQVQAVKECILDELENNFEINIESIDFLLGKI